MCVCARAHVRVCACARVRVCACVCIMMHKRLYTYRELITNYNYHALLQRSNKFIGGNLIPGRQYNTSIKCYSRQFHIGIILWGIFYWGATLYQVNF